MMNPDGSFNVERQHLNRWDNTYFHLVTMPSWKFFLLVFCSYLFINVFFATIYLIIGTDQLQGMKEGDFWSDFYTAYFFSTQTLTTVGYGHISPSGWSANIVASLESFAGLLAFSLISGLLYGRFSRPSAKIVFSPNLLVAPYKVGQGMMFRMANARKSELVETEVRVIIAMNQADETNTVIRRFFPLPLEIDKISFFSLSWTVVHAIGEASPLAGLTASELIEANAEFLVFVKSTDEVNQQTVYTRRSYIAEEIVWNARFQPVISRNAKGVPYVQNSQIGLYEPLGTP